MKVTQWRPDTCNCIISYEWDETLPIENRVHQFLDGTPCNEHTGLTGAELYHHVHAESATVQRAAAELKKTSKFGKDSLDKDGNVVGREFKPGFDLKCQFIGKGKDREINASLTGGTLITSEKTSVRNVSQLNLKEVSKELPDATITLKKVNI